MRSPWLSLCLTLPLAASPSLRVVAVERKGLPPFEDDRRVYRLEGEEAARLRPGDLLQLARTGDPRDPGRLKVIALEGGRVSALLETRGATYPLVGDQATARRMTPVPSLPVTAPLPDLALRPPRTAAPPDPPKAKAAPAETAAPAPAVPVPASPPAAPHGGAVAAAPPVVAAVARRHESIFFLEGDGSLSPKGREKLQGAVRAWGPEGPWSLAVPEDRVIPDKVRQARVQAIRRALGALGVGRTSLREVQRKDGDTGDVVYVEKG